jgi:hypothetical protein
MKRGDILRITRFRGQLFESRPLWAIYSGRTTMSGGGELTIVAGPALHMPGNTYRWPSSGWSLEHPHFDGHDKSPLYEVFPAGAVPDEYYAAKAASTLLGDMRE